MGLERDKDRERHLREDVNGLVVFEDILHACAVEELGKVDVAVCVCVCVCVCVMQGGCCRACA